MIKKNNNKAAITTTAKLNDKTQKDFLLYTYSVANSCINVMVSKSKLGGGECDILKFKKNHKKCIILRTFIISVLFLMFSTAYRTKSVTELMEWPESSYSVIRDLEWIFEGTFIFLITSSI